MGEILTRFRNCGVEDKDIARFARIIQYEAYFSLLYYLDDFDADNEGPLDSDENLRWAVAVTTEDAENDNLLDVSYERLSDFAPEGEWENLLAPEQGESDDV